MSPHLPPGYRGLGEREGREGEKEKGGEERMRKREGGRESRRKGGRDAVTPLEETREIWHLAL